MLFIDTHVRSEHIKACMTMINAKIRTLLPLERRAMRFTMDWELQLTASATFPLVKNELVQVEQNVKI